MQWVITWQVLAAFQNRLKARPLPAVAAQGNGDDAGHLGRKALAAPRPTPKAFAHSSGARAVSEGRRLPNGSERRQRTRQKPLRQDGGRGGSAANPERRAGTKFSLKSREI